MRICMLTSTFLPSIGGVELFVHRLGNHLSQLGNDVHIIAPITIGKRNKIKNIQRGYKIHRFPLPPRIGRFSLKPIFLKPMMFLSLFINSFIYKFDIIHANYVYPTGYVAALFHKVIKIPFIITVHAIDVQRFKEIDYGYTLDTKRRSKAQWALKEANEIIAISNSVKMSTLDIYKCEEKIRVIPTGVTRKYFLQSNKKSCYIKKSGPIIFSVGRNHPKKAFDDLIKAMVLIKEEFPKVQCVIVGYGFETLIPLVKKLGLQNHVTFPGTFSGVITRNGKVNFDAPHPDLLALYKSADIFVLPSLIEGFPLVIPEAMAAGLPIVTTNVPGNRDAVRDGYTGFLVPPRSHNVLAKYILKLLKNDNLRNKMGKNAFEFSERYDYFKLAQEYIDVYKTLM